MNALASAREPKRSGNTGANFNVLNHDSEQPGRGPTPGARLDPPAGWRAYDMIRTMLPVDTSTTAPETRRHPRPYPVRILGTGTYTPRRVVESAELDSVHNRTPGTTLAMSGVERRRWAGPEETSSVMGAGALRAAGSAAGLDTSQLDAVIVASVVPEQPMPTNAVLILRHLGLVQGRTEAFDVN